MKNTERKLLSITQKLKQTYTAQFAAPHQIEEIVRLGMLLVGDNHIDLHTLKRRYRLNDQIITCIYTRKPDGLVDPKPAGYYVLYPLTKEGYLSILNLDVINGKGIKDEYICSKHADPSAFYIGMAGGIQRRAQGAVINGVLEQVAPYLKAKKVKAFFGRGAAKDGIRLLSAFGLQKLPEPSQISCVYVNKEFLNSKKISKYVL